MSTILIYVILLSVEVIVVLGLRYMNINHLAKGFVDLELIISLLSTKILSYIVILFVSNFTMVRNHMAINNLHWVSIIIIPFGTLLSTILLISAQNPKNLSVILTGVVILFFVNIFVFYLYDVLMRSYQEKLNSTILKQLNKYYSKEIELIQRSSQTMKHLRHDWKHHISALKYLIENNKMTEAMDYITSISELMTSSKEYAKSGNIAVDSILNNKIAEAVNENMEVTLKLHIPDQLQVKPFDLCIILGNLLDNAIEANKKLQDPRWIKIGIEYNRNILYINIENPFDGEIRSRNGKLMTTNKDARNHGYGLASITQVIEKYNGTMNVNYADQIYRVNLIIYNINDNLTR
jgi:signal transduction histidine kinase